MSKRIVWTCNLCGCDKPPEDLAGIKFLRDECGGMQRVSTESPEAVKHICNSCLSGVRGRGFAPPSAMRGES